MEVDWTTTSPHPELFRRRQGHGGVVSRQRGAEKVATGAGRSRWTEEEVRGVLSPT